MKFALTSAWRTMPEHDYADLVQMFWLKFHYIKDYYPNIVTPNRFMAMFQFVCKNHVVNLAKKRTRRREVGGCSSAGDDAVSLIESLPDRHDGIFEVEDRISWEEAPEPVRSILEKFKGSDSPPCFIKVNGTRETTNEFLARLAGEDPEDINLVRMVRAWATGDSLCSA